MAEDDETDERAAATPNLTRVEQARILRALALRLDEGDPTLPTDVLGPLSRELDQRRDDEAIAAAWGEQAERKAEPWVFCRGRVLG